MVHHVNLTSHIYNSCESEINSKSKRMVELNLQITTSKSTLR